MDTLKNIIALIVFGLWIYAGVDLALNWSFGDFWDFAAYSGIMAFLFLLAMACISGIYSEGTNDPNPFC